MEKAIAYKRPTTPVRIRPYIFYRSVQNYTLINNQPGIQIPNVITLQPQGNIADGNRVTHGWKIYANLKWNSPTQPLILNINGNIVDFGAPIHPVLVIDTTLDPLGIDSTIYKIFNAWEDQENPENTVNLFVVEQILQISPM
jgi:hypothetical protein